MNRSKAFYRKGRKEDARMRYAMRPLRAPEGAGTTIRSGLIQKPDDIEIGGINSEARKP
jgi:hypothetical protein